MMHCYRAHVCGGDLSSRMEVWSSTSVNELSVHHSLVVLLAEFHSYWSHKAVSVTIDVTDDDSEALAALLRKRMEPGF